MRKSVGLVLVFVFLAACMIITMPVSASAEKTGNTWVSKAPMQVARSSFGVAVVNNKIYAIGELVLKYQTSMQVQSEEVTTNEQYDPATNTWTYKMSMPTPKSGFATAVYQGRIYCIGQGLNEVYDPATDTWENKTSLPIPIAQANVVDDKIYVIGGYPNNTLNEMYDPATDTWSAKAPIPKTGIEGGPAVASVVFDNKIYCFGGFYDNGYVSSTQIYDPDTDTWTTGAPPPTYFVIGAAATVNGYMAPKQICVFCHPYADLTAMRAPFYTNQVYYPANDSWVAGADLPTSREHFGVATVDDIVYVIGGYSLTFPSMLSINQGPTITYYSTVEAYTPYGYGTVPPAVSVISLESNKTYAGAEVDLNFTVNKPVAWMGYSLDELDNVTITGNTTMPSLTVGLHNVTVYAKDEFDNTGNSETIFFSVVEPFPTTWAVASIVPLAIACIGLLIYFKKRRAKSGETK